MEAREELYFGDEKIEEAVRKKLSGIEIAGGKQVEIIKI
jgi:hypothetical protein